MNVTIFSADTSLLIKQQKLNQLVNILPKELQLRATRYLSISSAYNFVIGRLLLKEGLNHFELGECLENVMVKKNGKPYLEDIFFNISHSNEQVLCAFSKEGAIGIDIEKIQAIKFEDFTAMFSNKEWYQIKNAADPLNMFYWFWTRKESIIKALGLKLQDLHEIELDVCQKEINIRNQHCYLKTDQLNSKYIISICSVKEIHHIEFITPCL